MNFLEIWEHPELFEQYDFSEIDKKVKAILKVRMRYDLYDKVIKELNNRVDIDYIKDSELLEGNEISLLKDINYDEDYEELYETNIFDKRVKNPAIDDFFFGKYRTILKKGRLVIYRKDPVTGHIHQFNSGMPKHLKALKDTLEQARKDQVMKAEGKKVNITSRFIESIHEKMFEDYIQINTRMNRIPGEPPVKPEGYGKFRRTIFINGNEHKYNVDVDGANWQPSDSDDVVDEMSKLINYYNESTLHPILKAAIFKACFIRIHPFRDGNGRTSRILLNHMLVREGYPTVTIKGIYKDKYFESLDKAIETGDYSSLIEMITTELNYRCKQYFSLMQKLNLKKSLPNSMEDVIDENEGGLTT